MKTKGCLFVFIREFKLLVLHCQVELLGFCPYSVDHCRSLKWNCVHRRAVKRLLFDTHPSFLMKDVMWYWCWRWCLCWCWCSLVLVLILVFRWCWCSFGVGVDVVGVVDDVGVPLVLVSMFLCCCCCCCCCWCWFWCSFGVGVDVPLVLVLLLSMLVLMLMLMLMVLVLMFLWGGRSVGLNFPALKLIPPLSLLPLFSNEFWHLSYTCWISPRSCRYLDIIVTGKVSQKWLLCRLKTQKERSHVQILRFRGQSIVKRYNVENVFLWAQSEDMSG